MKRFYEEMQISVKIVCNVTEYIKKQIEKSIQSSIMFVK